MGKGNPNMKKGAPSVNPKGRTPMLPELREDLALKCRKLTPIIIEALERALDSPRNVCQAAAILLERGYGKAAFVGDEHSPLRIEVSREAELVAKIQKLLPGK